jgi:hypothetical protein
MIVPVSTTAEDKVIALRQWASGRCLSASLPGVYRVGGNQDTKQRRNVKARE